MHVLRVLVVAGVAALAAGCDQTVSAGGCSASTCAGCCAADGTCLMGSAVDACGAGAGQCVDCAADGKICSLGVCRSGSGGAGGGVGGGSGGAGGGVAGGTGGGIAGGTGGGIAGGTGGGIAGGAGGGIAGGTGGGIAGGAGGSGSDAGAPCADGERLCGASCCPWNVTLVDSYLDVGDECSIALDSQGRPHLAYLLRNGATSVAVTYAHLSGTAWARSGVDSAAITAGMYPSIALDAADVPWVSYVAINRLRYATLTPTGWSADFVFPPATHQYGNSSMVIAANGEPRIAFYDGAVGVATHYTNSGVTGWSSNLVDSASQGKVSLVLDPEGNPHVAYKRSNGTSATGLAYALWDGDAGVGWVRSTIDANAVFAPSPGLALTAAGRPIVSYYDVTQGRLNVASWNGTAWQVDSLPGSADGLYNTSLGVDAAGRVHVAYAGTRPGSATWGVIHASHDGSGWILEMVAPGGTWSSLVLDASGTPHLCYQDDWRKLRYATY